MTHTPVALPRRRGFDPLALVVTVGGCGRSPVAPGTVGALAALPLTWALDLLSAPIHISALVLTAALGVVASDLYCQRGGDSDPQEVVIDELAGCAVAVAFVPWTVGWVLAAFGLFRLFDIVKPGPVGWAERRLGGGLGIMADDLVAGVLAGLDLWCVRWLVHALGWD